MLRITAKGAGGYYLYKDPIMELDIGWSAYLMFALMLIVPMIPSGLRPGYFGSAVACLAVGLMIFFFISTIEIFSFLRPLSMPFFICAMFEYSLSVFDAVRELFGFFMILVAPMYLFVSGYFAYACLGLMHSDILLSICALLTGGAMVYMTYPTKNPGYELPAYADYMIYACFLLGIIGVINALVKYVKTDLNMKKLVGDLIANGLIAVLGIVPVWFFTFFADGKKSWFFAVFFLLLYILAVIVFSSVMRLLNISVNGTSEGILLPLIISGICRFVIVSDYYSNAVGKMMSVFRHAPVKNFFVKAGEGMLYVFGRFFGAVYYGIKGLFTGGTELKKLPDTITFIILIVLLDLVVIFTSMAFSKLSGKTNKKK